MVRIVVLLVFVISRTAMAEPLAIRGATMGTTYQIKIVAEPAAVDLTKLKTDVEKILAEVDEQMSSWRADSEVSRFNRAAADEWFTVSAATAEVVAAAQEISRDTDGALDITVGPLVRLWHFGPDVSAEQRRTAKLEPPSDEAIEKARQLVGYTKLEIRRKPPALRKQIDGLEIDLSSIASGYTIDRLAAQLKARGINSFLVDLGGEVRAGGSRSDGQPWQVAIERPVPGEPQMQSSVPLENGAIATSGDYQKFFEFGGRRYSHIINPSTGRPVKHAIASVTVVADTCLEADGWDTPLLVLGPTRGYECAERHDIAALFIARGDETEEGKPTENIEATPAWQAKFGNRRQ